MIPLGDKIGWIHVPPYGEVWHNEVCAFSFSPSQGAKASAGVQVEIPADEWGVKEPETIEPGEEKTPLEPTNLVIAGKR